MSVRDFVIRMAFIATELNIFFSLSLTYFPFRVLFLIKTPWSSSPFLGFSSKEMLGYIGVQRECSLKS